LPASAFKMLVRAFQFAQQRKELRRTRLDVSKRNRLLSELKGKVASQARQLHEVHSQLLELVGLKDDFFL